MTRPSKVEQDKMLEDLAYAVRNHLVNVGCTRKADNVSPDTMTVEEICQKFDIASAMWGAVTDKALELGIPLVYGYFAGYYIGKKGEEGRLLVHKQAMLKGIAQKINTEIFYLGKNGTLEDAQEYAKIALQCPLADIPSMLKALGAPLPKSVAGYLEETAGSGFLGA